MLTTKNILLLLLIHLAFFSNSGCKQANDKKASDRESVQKPVSDEANEPDDDDVDSSATTNLPDNSPSYPNIYEPEPAEDQAKKYQNLLVFHVEDSMKVGQNYVASLDLAKDEAVEAVRKKIYDEKGDTSGVTKIDTTLTITPRMKALLLPNKTDSDKLEVTLLSSSNELDLSTGKATWRWRLEPKQEGQIKLTLVVEVVSDDSKITPLPPRFYDIKIYSEGEGFLSKAGGFFGGNWQWLLSAILIPFMIAWYTIRQTNKSRHERKLAEEKKRSEANRY